jgi:hypothetical protein
MSGKKKMEETKILFQGPIFTLHSQVILLDNEADQGFPKMRTGSESVAYGEQGVVVAVKEDFETEVIVCQGKDEPDHVFCVTGQIRVSNQGLLVGNIEAATIANIPWSRGRTLVTIYTNGIFTNATKVIFYLEHLGEN